MYYAHFIFSCTKLHTITPCVCINVCVCVYEKHTHIYYMYMYTYISTHSHTMPNKIVNINCSSTKLLPLSLFPVRSHAHLHTEIRSTHRHIRGCILLYYLFQLHDITPVQNCCLCFSLCLQPHAYCPTLIVPTRLSPSLASIYPC